MKKIKSLWLYVGLVLIALTALLVYVNNKSDVGSDAAKSVVDLPSEGSHEPTDNLSVEEANELMRRKTPDDTLNDLYQDYRVNNSIYMDESAVCNLGMEGLSDFVDRFKSDASFRQQRTKLVCDDGGRFDYADLNITVSDPDSTNFFSAWSAIAPNDAVFCRGFLGSEMVEEFTFQRADSLSGWFLVDYFNVTAVPLI
ncbi:MAG: hypothetical protein Q4E10_00840 [Porphyromonas sp.]|nr:hypothetical protein [Porphyromonas sp.]